MTDTEKNLLPKFSAWRILETNHILSDQFTNTTKIDHNRKIFFIQISGDGTIVNSSLAGELKKIKKAKIQGDTLRIKTSDRLSLRHGDKRISLSEGMLIQRIFIHRNKTFARDIAGDISGWIEGNGPAHWESYVPERSGLALEKQIFSRVDHIFMSYNVRIDKLFAHLNKVYDESKISPQWRHEDSPSYLKYTMVPREYMNQFSKSQSYLVQELNDLLYGSAYQLTAEDGQIIISKSSR